MATPQLDSARFDDEPDSLQKVSVGRQALRREVNERIGRLNAGWGTDRFDVFCECGRARCAERVTIAASTYEELRRVPTHFLVKLGHTDGVERVVGEYDEFVIVEKFGRSGIEAISLERRNGRSA
jgi:hypothetical protein